MKKNAFVLVMCLVLIGLAGCAQQGLALTDFDIYENGKLMLKALDYETSGGGFSDYESRYIGFATAQRYDYVGRVLETKRGIKIGSTVREVVEAYSSIPASISVADYTIMDINDFLNNRSDYPVQDAVGGDYDYSIRYTAFDYKGKLINDQLALTEIDEETWKEMIETLKDGKSASYELWFNITGDVVSDINIAVRGNK